MPVTHHKCEGFEDFSNLIKTLEGNSQPVYVMFSGSHDEDGKSWCPDCVKAKPVVDEYLKGIEDEKDIHFVYVGIERALWKESNNPFRTDTKLSLKRVPTIIKWNSVERLEEDECANKSLLNMLFE